MGKRLVVPDFGVEIIEGLPGSGKSFMAVQRMLERALLEQRRPVFTNLPLRWRVLRAHLRTLGGPTLARLLYQLDRDHFQRFLDRAAERAEFVQRHKGFRDDKGQRLFTARRVMEMWYEQAGPDVVEGEGANWITAGSVVILDEVHLWYPMAEQARESPNLLKYLSMHRHHLHWVWAITQERGRISKSFRVMCTKFWTVRNKGEDKVAWGIRFKHVGISAFGYVAYSGDQAEGRTMDDASPLANYVVLPWLPKYRKFFRFYDSFTNTGNVKALVRDMKRLRVASGLTEDGGEVGGGAGEPAADGPAVAVVGGSSNVEGANVATVAVKGAGRGILGRVAVGLGGLVLVGVGAMAGRGCGADRVGPAPAAAVSGGPAAVAVKEEAPAWGRWNGVSKGAIILDGKRIATGGRLPNGAVLADVDPAGRGCLLQLGPDIWMWRFGQAEPERLGRAGLVVAALRSIQGGAVGGGGVGAPGASAGEAVGPASGDGGIRGGSGGGGGAGSGAASGGQR